MTIQDDIAKIRDELNAVPLIAWDEINKIIKEENYSMEKRVALHQLRCEVASILNEQLLISWLTIQGISEAKWSNYGFDGVHIYEEGKEINALEGFN